MPSCKLSVCPRWCRLKVDDVAVQVAAAEIVGLGEDVVVVVVAVAVAPSAVY